MASLEGQTIASTYKQLLKITSEGVGADASAKYIEDGLGTDTALSLSTTRVGIGTASPSNQLHLESSTSTTMLMKNTGNSGSQIDGDANRSSADSTIMGIVGKWNGTTVGDMLIVSGSDTTNKDDGEFVFRTAPSGSLVERLRIKANGEVQFGSSGGTADLYHYGEGKFAINDSAGSASTPTYSFNSDTDTGMYRAAANEIGFATNSSEKIRITSEGRVIQKNTTLANSCFDIVNGSSSGYGLYIKAGNGGNYALAVNDYNANGLMAVLGNGNVGIGVTSPGYLTELRVNDTVSDTPRFVIRQLGTGDSSLAFQMPDSPYGFTMGVDNSDSDRFKISTGVGDVGGSGEKMSIDPNGMITFTNSSARFNFYANSDTDIVQYFGGHDTSDTIRIAASVAVATTAASNACDGELIFATASSNTNTERMRITSDGDIGIGDTSPSTALTSFGSTSKGLSIKNAQPTIALVETDDSDKQFWIAKANGNAYLQNQGNGFMRFYTDGNQRMQIGSDGSVAIGLNHSSSATLGLHVKAEDGGQATFIENTWNGSPDASSVLDVKSTNTNKANNLIRGYNGGSNVFVVEIDGDVNNTNGSYGSSVSDRRLKENITNATNKLDSLNALSVKNFNFKGSDKKQIGFIADEFEQVFPSLVTQRDTREYDEDDNVVSGYEDTKGLKVGMEFAILVKAIQELSAKVEALENA